MSCKSKWTFDLLLLKSLSQKNIYMKLNVGQQEIFFSAMKRHEQSEMSIENNCECNLIERNLNANESLQQIVEMILYLSSEEYKQTHF